jgi:urocanate hydratase
MGAGGRFKYPSYVEDIMGDIFSLGFGPFRWVCTSGDEEDLRTTDQFLPPPPLPTLNLLNPLKSKL